MARTTVPPMAYTITEALDAVPIGRTKLKELIASGALPTVLVGRKRLIPVAALEALLLDGAA